MRREAIVTESASGKVEISLDRGVVKCDRARAPISEVELELKEGDPTDLSFVFLDQSLSRRV